MLTSDHETEQQKQDRIDAHGLAYYLVNQLNDAELRRYRREKQDDQA